MSIITARLGTSQLNLIADILNSIPPCKRQTRASIILHFVGELKARGVNPKFKPNYFVDAAQNGVKKKRPGRNQT